MSNGAIDPWDRRLPFFSGANVVTARYCFHWRMPAYSFQSRQWPSVNSLWPDLLCQARLEELPCCICRTVIGIQIDGTLEMLQCLFMRFRLYLSEPAKVIRFRIVRTNFDDLCKILDTFLEIVTYKRIHATFKSIV